ncbi:phosphatase PAP2 family protein [soil metagenome]
MTDSDPAAPGTALRRPPVLLADPIVLSLVYVLLVSVFFLAFPRVDLWASGLFYDSATHDFPMRRLPAFQGLRSFGEWTLGLTIAALIAAILVKLLRPARPTPIPPRAILFIASTLAAGPGLVVNLLFKNQWGRPRPYSVDVFGGQFPFVDAWSFSTSCATNCSFVSGEASSALWLLTIAMVAPPAWRRPLAWTIVVIALLLSLNRIAFGGHFLSDVLLSWGITMVVIFALHRVIYTSAALAPFDASFEDVLTRAGNALRARISGKKA